MSHRCISTTRPRRRCSRLKARADFRTRRASSKAHTPGAGRAISGPMCSLEAWLSQMLHARGPILRTKKSLGGMRSGQLLKMLATDPGSVKDMEVFAKQTGHALLASDTQDASFVYFLQKT